MTVVINQEGMRYNAPKKSITINEGDIKPDNTNKNEGTIRNGSDLTEVGSTSMKVYIFNEELNEWKCIVSTPYITAL